MKQAIAIRKPVDYFQVDASVPADNISVSTPKILVQASEAKAASAVEITNTTGKVLLLLRGETDSEEIIPYYISPSMAQIMVPMELKAGEQLQVLALGSAADSGMFILNLFA